MLYRACRFKLKMQVDGGEKVFTSGHSFSYKRIHLRIQQYLSLVFLHVILLKIKPYRSNPKERVNIQLSIENDCKRIPSKPLQREILFIIAMKLFMVNLQNALQKTSVKEQRSTGVRAGICSLCGRHVQTWVALTVFTLFLNLCEL